MPATPINKVGSHNLPHMYTDHIRGKRTGITADCHPHSHTRLSPHLYHTTTAMSLPLGKAYILCSYTLKHTQLPLACCTPTTADKVQAAHQWLLHPTRHMQGLYSSLAKHTLAATRSTQHATHPVTPTHPLQMDGPQQHAKESSHPDKSCNIAA